ncbi:hypothetical protein E3N88_38112 [Mikania micrantha]|uniref:Uncharacterized protein n=1 Tax=Mikania micrantha TaxID=192012 RepID=A0A5N6LTU1_9ASTR|nr:hypothetical protein E3N88_38112 [Mikania micrantha]
MRNECTCKLSWETSKGGDQAGTHLTHHTLISRDTNYICGMYSLGTSWDRAKGVYLNHMRIDGKVGRGDGTIGTLSTIFKRVDTSLMREECNTKLFREPSQGGDQVGTKCTHINLFSRGPNLHYEIIGKQRVTGWEYACFAGGNTSGKRGWILQRLQVMIYGLGGKSLHPFAWLCMNNIWRGRLNRLQTLRRARDSKWSAWFSNASDTAWNEVGDDFGLGIWGMIWISLTWIIHHQRWQLQSPYNGISTQGQGGGVHQAQLGIGLEWPGQKFGGVDQLEEEGGLVPRPRPLLLRFHGGLPLPRPCAGYGSGEDGLVAPVGARGAVGATKAAGVEPWRASMRMTSSLSMEMASSQAEGSGMSSLAMAVGRVN